MGRIKDINSKREEEFIWSNSLARNALAWSQVDVNNGGVDSMLEPDSRLLKPKNIWRLLVLLVFEVTESELLLSMSGSDAALVHSDPKPKWLKYDCIAPQSNT